MPIAVGQFTIYDFYDIQGSTAPPTNPVKDQVWLDTSLNPPVMKIWSGKEWLISNDYVSGFVNLLYNTGKMKTTEYWYLNKASGTAGLTLVDDPEVGKAIKFNIGTDVTSWCYFGNNSYKGRKFEVGQDYTISFLAKSNDVRKLNLKFMDGNSSNQSIAFGEVMLNTGWQRFELTAKATAVGVENLLYIVARGTGAKEIHMTKLKLETGNRASDWSAASEDLEKEVVKLSADLDITKESITQRVTKEEYTKDKTTLDSRLSTAEGSITTLAGQVSLKASKTEVYTKGETDGKVGEVTERVKKAEAEIKVNADNITQTVKKTDYNGETLVSMINQTADTIKISAKNINLNGAVTFSSFDGSTQNKINTIESTAGTAKSTADTAKSTADTAKSTADTAKSTASSAQTAANTANSKLDTWSHPTDKTTINGGKIMTGSITAQQIAAQTITADKLAIGDFTNYAQLNDMTYAKWGFTKGTNEADGAWLTRTSMRRDILISDYYTCNGGESFRVKGDISTTIKGSTTNGGTDSKFVGTAIGIFAYDGTGKNVGYLYGKRAKNQTISVSDTITLPATARKFRVYIQTEGWGNWSGTLKVRNVQVIKMTNGELVVNGSITAGMISTGKLTALNGRTEFDLDNSRLVTYNENKNPTMSITDGMLIFHDFEAEGGGVVFDTNVGTLFVEPLVSGNASGRVGINFDSGLNSAISLGYTASKYGRQSIVDIYGQGDVSTNEGRMDVHGSLTAYNGLNVYNNLSANYVSVGDTKIRSNAIEIKGTDANGVTASCTFDAWNQSAFRLRIGGSGNFAGKFAIQGGSDANMAVFTQTSLTIGAVDANEKNLIMNAKNTSMTGRCGMYINTTNFGLYDWQNSRSVLQYNQSTGQVLIAAKTLMYATSANGYMGLSPNGNNSEWVRTTTSGLIPAASGGNSSSLGTDTWAFKEIWGMNLYSKGKIQVYTGYGTNLILAGGTGDGINYGTNNMRTRCHYGWGISDNSDNTNAVIDARAGRFIGKAAYWHNSSKSLKSDVRVVISEEEPMAINMRNYDTIDDTVTFEMIEDFLDTINIKTYVSDYKQEGVKQEDHDDSKAHITQLGYIADEFAEHPLFKYVGEMIGEYHAINTTALISTLIAGYQSEKRKRMKLELKVEDLETKLNQVLEKLGM